jgi:multimeric flavodoxin WrbA
MKAAILNGVSENDHESQNIHDALVKVLLARHWRVTSLTLRELDITCCHGCFHCWTKSPGICKIKDDGQHIARDIITSDLAVPFTAVTFGGYSAELKKAIDRALCLISPFFTIIDGEVHHQKRYERYPYWLTVGTLPGPDEASERIFKTLARRNALNLHTNASSEVFYLNAGKKNHSHESMQTLLARLEADQ